MTRRLTILGSAAALVYGIVILCTGCAGLVHVDASSWVDRPAVRQTVQQLGNAAERIADATEATQHRIEGSEKRAQTYHPLWVATLATVFVILLGYACSNKWSIQRHAWHYLRKWFRR